jgi:uncharacterized protein YegJ (DUF2314 family)
MNGLAGVVAISAARSSRAFFRRAGLATLGLTLPMLVGRARDPYFYRVDKEDAEMTAAMVRARAEVAVFIDRLSHPREGDEDFSVKLPIRDGRNVEHFWLNDVRCENGRFYGTLDNEPELIRCHHHGEALSVVAGEISDWMYIHEGRLVGGYTVRLMRQRLNPKDRQKMDEQLQFRID